MARDKEQVRIALTPEQRNQVRQAIGKDAEALELTVQELEQRIAPTTLGVGARVPPGPSSG